MADFRVVCATNERTHRHITHVGTGSDAGATMYWTVDEVRRAINDGDTFYTISPSTGAFAVVEGATCGKDGCEVKTIRTVVDAISDNNLDNLPRCTS